LRDLRQAVVIEQARRVLRIRSFDPFPDRVEQRAQCVAGVFGVGAHEERGGAVAQPPKLLGHLHARRKNIVLLLSESVTQSLRHAANELRREGARRQVARRLHLSHGRVDAQLGLVDHVFKHEG
jgi:hypothetical protein